MRQGYKERIEALISQGQSWAHYQFNPTTAKKGISKKKRFSDALKMAGHADFAQTIDRCKTKSPCGSIYCGRCRTALGNRLLARTNNRFSGSPNSILQSVRHVTGLVSIEELNTVQIRIAINDARKWFEEAKRKRPWLKIVGTFELELTSFGHLDRMSVAKSSVKRDQLQNMLKGTLTRFWFNDDELVVLVHWHALTSGLEDKSDPRGKVKGIRKRSALDVLKTHYGKHYRQLYIQKLHDPAKRSVSESLSRISHYPYKDAYRLKYSFEGDSCTNGEYVDDKTLGRFIKVYREVGGVGNRGLRIDY